MALSPISSIGSYSKVQPLNYKLSNESEVSAAYTESMTKVGGSADRVLPVSPVAYPDSRRVELSQSDKQKADAMFNKLAGSFNNAVTGYERNGSSGSYSTTGSNIDYMV